MAGSPLTDALGILHSAYPQARVTSSYRDPNSALGRENPRSYHNIGQAFDVAPMPGVKFGDYVNGLKQKGLNVVESLDEAAHPAFDTTGPNWHVAFGARTAPPATPYYSPQPPQPQGQPPMPPQMPPMSLGQMAGQPMPPPNMDSNPMQPTPQSLGQMADALPQGNIPQKSHSKFTAGNIMGVLGDALSAYGGRQPTFAPFLRERQMMGQQQNFEREKFQQELAMRMFAMTHPEEMMKAQSFQAAPQSVRQSMVDYENTMHPDVVGVQQPNGSVINQVQPRKLAYQPGDIHPGTDGNYMFMGGDPTSQASWKKVQ